VIRAFAFDLDETLTDCEPQHVAATRAMLHAIGADPAKVADAFHDITGKRTRDVVETIREAAGAKPSVDELLALRHAAFLAALDEAPAQPRSGALDLVRACRARGPVALVTSGHRDDALATLGSLRATPLFNAIVTGEDVELPKPDPEPYRIAASRLGVPAADVLVFEDSARGVASAKAAGCRVVAVPNARSTRSEQVRAADIVLAEPGDALPLETLLARLA
jgi:HAD superfamily hydrolase (TIGR01509 family)